MTERLVDVLRSNRNGVLHTYPITVDASGAAASDAVFEARAVRAAAFSHLVPDRDLSSLSTRMHVGRSGALSPSGDCQDVLSETKEGLCVAVRTLAYDLWQRAGCPEGKADQFWSTARHDYLARRAYCLWEQEGRPEGRADEYWRRTLEFEDLSTPFETIC